MLKLRLLLAVAAVLVLLGAFLPEGWYDRLPRQHLAIASGISGVRLLKICLMVQGALLAVCALVLRGRLGAVPLECHISEAMPAGVTATTWERGALIGIVGMGLILRLFRLDTDLWVDEITTIVSYRDVSYLQVVATYINSNNHLLNTLLMKGAIGLFGDHEWAVRLPAALFGTATIPLLYLASRVVAGRPASLLAAALLAFSSHHIFYSQNARGYTAHVFFSLLAAVALVRAMGGGDARWWVLLVGATFLNVASLLLSAWVAVGQAVAAVTAAIWVAHRARKSAWPMLARLVAAFGVSGALALNLYAPVLSEISAFMQRTYTQTATGFGLLSGEFFRELGRGLTVGFGPGVWLAAVPVLAAATWGFWLFARKSPLLASSLTLPLVATAAYLLVKGYTFSPRFFILGLPVAVLSIVCLLDWVTMTIARRWPRLGGSSTALSLAAAAVSLASAFPLLRYYQVPKQDYRGAFADVAFRRRPGDGIIGVYLMKWGFVRYASHFGWREGQDYTLVRSLEAFRAAQARYPRSLVVTTFPRALALEFPDLHREIVDRWRVVAEFPGAVGDGDVQVLELKPTPRDPN